MINFLKFKINRYLLIVLFGICSTIFSLEAKASTFYFMPQTEDVYSGDTFIVEAYIDTEKREINAIEGSIIFPNGKLNIVDIGTGESVINLWTKNPVYSNEKGEISFSGGMPNGFNGQGVMLKITFKAIGNDISQKSAGIYFSDNSRALLNDGKGSEDKIFFLNADYELVEREQGLPVLSSPTCPEQEKWCKGDSVQMHWDLIKGAEYSYILSKDAASEPDDIPDKPEGDLQWMGDMTLKGFPGDGIYYFNLKQKLSKEGWSKKVTYRIMIDNISPEDFTLRVAEIEGKKYAVFNTVDKTSGIDGYFIKESKKSGILDKLTKRDEKNYQKAASPYLLSDQTLESIISVKAVDKAGNEKIAEYKPALGQKSYIYRVAIIAIVIIIFIIFYLIKRKVKNNRRDKSSYAGKLK